MRLLQWARNAVAGLPVPVAIVFALSMIFSLLAFNQGDLNHTVGSSYAYLFGHVFDFYDFNKPVFGGNDYFPTTYIIFAIWMAPVKLIMSPGIQNGLALSSVEVAWAKVLLLIFFIATFIVISKIAKELFPNRPNTQTTVRITFLLSPLAAFCFDVFGQYDIIGVFFTSVGFLYYLRGDKWRFAIFFALAASSKYFALVIFIPLLLLQFKKLKDIILLGLVALSALVLEALIYLPDQAFREHTLFGLVGGKVTGAGTQIITMFVAAIFVVGLIVLWRARPTRETLGPWAVYGVIGAYGLMFTAVVWHPQWFIILTPFFALSVGYLRRPVWFLIWDSIFFLIFIWLVVNAWVANVDLTMVNLGPLKSILPNPLLIGSDFYPGEVVVPLHFLLIFYLFSPIGFFVIERVRAVGPSEDGRKMPIGFWILRVLTLPIVWIVPVIIALVIPVSAAEAINPRAATLSMLPSSSCAVVDQPYGEIFDDEVVDQKFIAQSNRLSAVSFTVATYARAAAGDLNLKLLDRDGVVQAEKTIDLADVLDNSVQYFVFPAVKTAKGRHFTLEASTSGTTEGKGIALWGASTDCDPDGTLKLNGAVQVGDLAITTYYVQG